MSTLGQFLYNALWAFLLSGLFLWFIGAFKHRHTWQPVWRYQKMIDGKWVDQPIPKGMHYCLKCKAKIILEKSDV